MKTPISIAVLITLLSFASFPVGMTKTTTGTGVRIREVAPDDPNPAHSSPSPDRPNSSFRAYLPHWTTEDGFVSILYIRNVQMVNAVSARLSLILKHKTIPLAERQIEAAQTIAVDIKQELIAAGEKAEQDGGAVLDYTANSSGGINAWAQVVNETKSLSFSFSFMPDGASHPGPLDAVAWFYDRGTDGFVSVQNTTDNFVLVHPTVFVDGQPRPIETKPLKPHEAATLRLPPPAGNEVYPFSEGVRIDYDAPAGAIVAQGWAMNPQRGFSVAYAFHHNGTCPCKPGELHHLYGTGVAIGTGTMMAPGATFHPELVLRNNSSSAMTVTPIFKYHVDGRSVSVTLPAADLGPQITTVRDLRQYQLDGVIPLTVNDGNLQLDYHSDSGVLIGELASVDTDGSFVSTVPLICSGNRALHMAFWRTDGDWDSMLTIENISTLSNEVEITISYPGGLYIVEKTLAAGETGMVSVKELQRSQTPDRDGHTIPITATVGGMNVWSKNVNNGLIINGMIVNPVARTCGYCGGFGIANEWGLSNTPRNCFQGFNEYSVGDVVSLHMWIYFSTNQCGDDTVQNVNVSTPLILQPGQDSTTVVAVGVGIGMVSADSQGTWPTDEQQCDFGTSGHLNSSGQITVRPRIDDITPDQGPIDSSVGISIGGSGFRSNPTVNVAGITTSVQSSTSSTISVTLTIPPNATPGNHAVTVTANGQTSNSVNFFVQIPTKLRRDSYGTLQDQQGGCGATRSLQYTLLDQEDPAAPIDTNGTIAEGISNYNGPSGVRPTENSRIMNHGGFPDIVGYLFSPDCPPPFTATYTQTFVVTLYTPGYAWVLSSRNDISMGRTSSGSKFVDLNFTP